MRNVAANFRFWVTGTVIALVGVTLARVVTPLVTRDWKIFCTLGGQLLAFTGLAILAVGVSRRIRRASESERS